MRQILSTTLVALIVGAVAGASMGALAQSSPATDSTIAPAAVSNINAHRVDGKHAVGAKATIQQRKGKLVATDSTGFLPRNIVKPLWGLIQNKPGFLADGQVNWDEVQGIPAGFADGLDNQGVTGATVTRLYSSYSLANNATHTLLSPSCPVGSTVVGGGYHAGFYGVEVAVSQPNGSTWMASFRNLSGGTATIYAWVLCLSIDPAGNLTTLGRKTGIKAARLP